MKNDEITEKREKWEMHTVGPGIWQENWKSWKMRITLVRWWNWQEILKNMKNEKCTL